MKKNVFQRSNAYDIKRMNVAEQNAKQSWKVQTVEAAIVIVPLETGGSLQKRAK